MIEADSKNDQVVLSSGEALESSFAAQLKQMAETGQNSLAAALLEAATRADVFEQQSIIEKLGDKLESIGSQWQDVTFNRSYKKAAVLPVLQTEWASLTNLALLDPEARLALLNRFTRGLRVKEGESTRTQERYIISVSGFESHYRDDSLTHFVDGVDRYKIRFAVAPFITLAAILELSGYPNNPILDSFQSFLAQSDIYTQLIAQEEVKLPLFLTILNNWFSSMVESQATKLP